MQRPPSMTDVRLFCAHTTSSLYFREALNLPNTSTALPWRWLVPISLVPAVVALLQLGRLHPDEVYQWLEPAYRRAFGYGIVAWEWETGLRNWAIPGVFAALLKLAHHLGVTHPWGLRAVLEIPQWGLHLLSLAAAYRYVERRVEGTLAQKSLVWLGLWGPLIAFAGRTMGESFSAAFLIVAFERLDAAKASTRGPAFWGGLFLGLAVVARYPSAVFVLVACVWILVRRSWRVGWEVLAAGACVAAALGVLDFVTWGKPFHSMWGYFHFNVTSGQAAAKFGQEGMGFYALPWLVNAPLWAWVGFLYSLRHKKTDTLEVTWAVGIYLLVTSLVGHKEIRFLYPAGVLFALSQAPHFARWVQTLRPSRKTAAMVVATFVSVAPWFFDFGLSASRGDQFHALIRASRGNTTGLLLVNEGLWGAGGYFYLGKNIPWMTCDWATEPAFQRAMSDARFNRVVTYDGRALPELQKSGFVVMETIGHATWLRR